LCVDWLIRCQILSAEHVVASDNAEVFDLAQLLRDGVILCHLANHLHPGAVDPKEFTLRPQMSQVRLQRVQFAPPIAHCSYIQFA